MPNEFVGTCAFFLATDFDREGFLTVRGACRFWRDVSVAGCRINLSAYTDKFCFEFFVIRWAGHASAHHRWWWDGVGIQPVGEQEDGCMTKFLVTPMHKSLKARQACRHVLYPER